MNHSHMPLGLQIKKLRPRGWKTAPPPPGIWESLPGTRTPGCLMSFNWQMMTQGINWWKHTSLLLQCAHLSEDFITPPTPGRVLETGLNSCYWINETSYNHISGRVHSVMRCFRTVVLKLLYFADQWEKNVLIRRTATELLILYFLPLAY